MLIKKKILIRIGSLRHGGAEKVLVTFLKNIPENKYEIDLLLNLKFGKYLPEVPNWINIYHLHEGEMITTNKPCEIPVKVYRRSKEEILKIFPNILYKYILKKKDYDVELIANHTLLEEVLKSPVKNSKKIVWIHSDLFKIPKYSKDKLKKFFKADRILAISENIKNGFDNLASSKEEKDKIIKIYNPINSNEILQKAVDKKEIDFITGKEKIFVAIGTVYPAKGFDRLINVHIKLLKEGLKHKICIVGDGYDFNNLNNFVKLHKLEDTIHMIGYRNNPYPYLKKSDFFILSSRYEGYPTVLFEALALKKPIIATDVSGVREMLQEGELGKIVENSEEGIYEGMKEFLSHTKTPDAYIQKLEKEDLPFTLENSVKKLMDIIDNN